MSKLETLLAMENELQEAEYFRDSVGRFGHPEVTYRQACKQVANIKARIKAYKKENNISSQMSKEQALEIIESRGIQVRFGSGEAKYILHWEHGLNSIMNFVPDGRALVRIARHIDDWKEDMEVSYAEAVSELA